MTAAYPAICDICPNADATGECPGCRTDEEPAEGFWLPGAGRGDAEAQARVDDEVYPWKGVREE